MTEEEKLEYALRKAELHMQDFEFLTIAEDTELPEDEALWDEIYEIITKKIEVRLVD